MSEIPLAHRARLTRTQLLAGFTAVVAVLAVAAIFFVGLTLTSQVGNRPRPNTQAPDFGLALYPKRDGGFASPLRLSELRGRIVVVNFWASWCVPCRDEAPALESLWRHYRGLGQKVVFIGVGYLDTEADAERFMTEFGITYPNGADMQQQVSRQYRITGVPETYVVDQQGVVRNVFVAPITQEQLRSAIDPLLVPGSR